ncbi:hypothetical protein QYM36_013423 [Artemia franciscana]|uniref:Uncharacterized protein n=1 Tax=Artemia franciscana TaxID=6661 RepID=A0AA88HIQ7_ARTSF|nr:hypothetical protein QYM36_013423 [Artemia franciscana]KAK2709744.1 hypothetical protein QYM36_013423 [Artemia franciscana]
MAILSMILSNLFWPLPITMYIVETGCILLLVKLLIRLTNGVCSSTNRLDGKVVIITGSSSGIGLEVMRNLAFRGAKIYMAVPDVDNAKVLRDGTSAESGNAQIFVKYIDLTSLKSVRDFVEEFLSVESRLDVLINNAGMAAIKKSLTSDGLETQMACNYFGHFLLTRILLDTMKKSAPSRIISTSSMLHWTCRRINLSDLNFKKSSSGNGIMEIYATSKTCLILFTRELAKRLHGTGVEAYSVHPGAITSTAFLNCFPWYFRTFVWALTMMVSKTSVEGAQPIIDLAVSEHIEGESGDYFVDCKVARTSWLAKDEDLARKLWTATEDIVGIS